MTNTLDQLIAEVRIELRQPELYAPGDDLIGMKAWDVAQHFRLQQALTGVNWDYWHWTLRTVPGQSLYPAPYQDADESGLRFGKPDSARTIDVQNLSHVSRKIPIIERHLLEEHFVGSGRGSGRHDAACFVFFRHSDQPYFEIFPTPASADEYRIWFAGGEIESLVSVEQSVPVLREYYRYLRMKTSWQLLPYCEWGDFPKELALVDRLKLRQARQMELGTPLVAFIGQWEKAWQEYIDTSVQGSLEPNYYGGLPDFG